MDRDESLIEYPCRFPIKVMGRNEDDLESLVTTLLEGLLQRPEALELSARESSSGNFLSVTVTITATSREELDGVYAAFTEHERILMVL